MLTLPWWRMLAGGMPCEGAYCGVGESSAWSRINTSAEISAAIFQFMLHLWAFMATSFSRPPELCFASAVCASHRLFWLVFLQVALFSWPTLHTCKGWCVPSISYTLHSLLLSSLGLLASSFWLVCLFVCLFVACFFFLSHFFYTTKSPKTNNWG